MLWLKLAILLFIFCLFSLSFIFLFSYFPVGYLYIFKDPLLINLVISHIFVSTVFLVVALKIIIYICNITMS